MANGDAKYHHLIPQTYLAAWEHGKGTLYVRSKESDQVCERNKAKLGGLPEYHSIVAGMPIVTKADADIIFECVSSFKVRYGGSVISDSLELNKIYWDYENWSISREDGSPVGKKKIKAKIDQVKIRDIEKSWSERYENEWGNVRSDLTDRLVGATGESIEAIHKDYLMKFYTALDWRSFESNGLFKESFERLCNEVFRMDNFEIPEKKRKPRYCNTVSEEIRHAFLLKVYRQYFNGAGPMHEQAMADLAQTSFCFLIANDQGRFITSDNPAFVHKRQDGKLQGILPISPEIIMIRGKDAEKSDRYYVKRVTAEEIGKYNAIIEEHASQFLVQQNR